MEQSHSLKKKSKFSTLFLGAIGVVFGDIGTSPLYALREALSAHHAHEILPENIFSVLSLIFWTIMIVVSFKYVTVIMRADNNGEGGSLALLALVNKIAKSPNLTRWATFLGLCAAGFFFGDCLLTPAISVLSAVEGLKIVEPILDVYIIPITLMILSGLFWIQSHGTKTIGFCFGPIMSIWFLTIAILGLINIINYPSVLTAINPYYALRFVGTHYFQSLTVLGSVFLAVTGGEALYADMGHFGKSPIRWAWFVIALPSLLLNYFGQGALLLEYPEYITNPFYLLAPQTLQFPLVILATLATITASQAVISGAFSIVQQAVQLDYLPRVSILHTSVEDEGQIYVPFANWILYIGVFLLVIFFHNSSNLAGAYGISVAGEMLITTVLVSFVMKQQWNWSKWHVLAFLVPLFTVDFTFLFANALKIPHGGWLSLLIGSISYMFLSTWIQGRKIVRLETAKQSIELDSFIAKIEEKSVRVNGTAAVLTLDLKNAPLVLLKNCMHNQVLHEQIILLTVVTENIPYVMNKKRLELSSYDKGFYRLIVRYGFMQRPDLPKALAQCKELDLDLNKISYFLGHSNIIPARKYQISLFRKRMFAFMQRNATNSVDFFCLPSSQVFELGIWVEI